jgi:phosphate-selective porin OprO/OprP
MSGKTKWLLATSLVASMAFVVPVEAASKKAPSAKAPTNQELLERIEKLEQQLQDSKDGQKSVRARVTTLENNANDVQIGFANSRPTFKTGDGRFSLAIRARIQGDFAAFQQSDRGDIVKGSKYTGAGAAPFDLSTGSVFRRAYLGIEGLAFKDFWYEFRLNFGGSDAEAGAGTELNIARVAYIGIPHFRINAGVIQPVFTLGDTVSSGQLLFIERADIVNVAADSFGGTDARKGVEFTFMKDGMFYNGDNLILSAAYTGARTNAVNTAQGHGNGRDENSQVLGRAAFRFYSDDNSNFQFGMSGARILSLSGVGDTLTLQDRPEIRIDGTRLVSTGAMGSLATGNAGISSSTMYGFDLAGNYKNFYLGGEYHKYEVDLNTNSSGPRGSNPHFSGWYVEGSWILTGERKEYTKSGYNNEIGSWGAPKVVKPFSLAGNSWGVWEVAARYSSLNLNYNPTLSSANGGIAGGRENILTLGVNWYLNQNIRIMLNDLIVNVEKSAAAGGGAGNPLANNYGGQNMNVIAARLQFQM